MKALLTSILLTIITLHSQAQHIIPVRDSVNREILSFYDFKITENQDLYKVEYKDKTLSEIQQKTLTGKYMFQDSNSRTIDMELEDGVAIGDWQYYNSTYQGPIISSTVTFLNGYKNGTENIYSFEWNKETERYESYISRVIQYNMGKKQHDISYWANGTVFMEIQFDEMGKYHGNYIVFHADSTVSIHGNYEHGDAVGKWEYFYNSGIVSKEIFYRNGLVYTQTYHPNGNPHMSKSTKEQVFEGHYLNLDEKGDTLVYKFYKDGIEQGFQVDIFFTGYWQPRATEYYYTSDEGIIQGTYIQRFNDTGKLRVKGQYNTNSIRDGIWEYYQEDGRLYRTETFENGIQKASRTLWLQNKNGQYINAQYHLDKFPSGAKPRQVEKTPFFLFSE